MIALAEYSPPRNGDAEIAVIGGMLINREAVAEVVAVLSADAFFAERHRRIFRAMAAMSHRGDPVDLLTVGDELRRSGELDGIGGLDYLAEIVDTVPTAANIAYHARCVNETAELRRILQAGHDVVRSATAPDAKPEDVLSDGLQKLLAAHRNVGRGYVTPGSVIMDVMADIEREMVEGRRAGLRTGIPRIDQMTGGLQDGDLVVLAARPSMGKTALAVQMGLHAARDGKRVLMASLEMGSRQIYRRAIVSLARMSIDYVRQDLHRRSAVLAAAATELSTLPFLIDERPGENAETLRAGLQRAAAQNPPDLVIVDYLQLLEGKGENRVQQVSQISRSLKLLARDLECPVIALSQLSRAVESRNPPRPVLSDLRDTGAIEQDADVVLLLWRPEYYFTDDTKQDIKTKWQGRGELIVAKQRNGPTGAVKMLWEAPTTTFTEEAE